MENSESSASINDSKKVNVTERLTSTPVNF